ncbi:dienelactone hydrolase family protein [Modicisalibacter tunisiensis]|uniref:Dienelactone hydrolase family protein n=1 Tax=Modicisalibacter tunisiensis TaxID=390637 RepID=A0ABS7X2L7_9GAMM|nr:alpha/beta family hydrolase [Modicisalibacter tunisiensis]MBZ9537429.1 dienelactone hydrolase family protein [Modicisalibacter tunisiensis]MBZ9569148.1 dienelactone hydrolase family protein [Modicisalibacter tunisiensis]
MMLSPRTVTLEAAGVGLEGDLILPEGATGIVVFAHGSGSSRFSTRNRQVAEYLASLGLATLLFDLLTPDENVIDERTRELRFDIPLIGRRMTGAVDWVAQAEATRELAIGLFGASTGAAAALIAAAERPQAVYAVVSRGGRVDLADTALARVAAPTLLLVGGRDHQVIDLNEQARERMTAPCELVTVHGATHLFEEPGKLEEVQRLAAQWFLEHLAPQRSTP